ncbi:MAG: Tol biopolymer transport system component, partial [Thalassolituus oleivorans]
VRPFDLESHVWAGQQKAVSENAPVWLYEMDGFGNLYHRLFEATEAVGEVYILAQRLDGSAPRVLTSAPGVEQPRIEPSGSRVAMAVEAGDDYLMIYDPETDVQQRITFSGDEDHHAWSRDGERIMLERKGPLEILSTSGSRVLETLPVENARSFDWSLDGRWVAYNTAGETGVRLYDLESGQDTMLEPMDANEPSFSPDGTHVAYTLNTGTGLTTAVRSRDGQTVARLSLGGVEAGAPRWAPDGRSLFVRTQRDILRVPMDESKSQVGPAETVAASLWVNFAFDIGPDETLYYTTNRPGTQAIDHTERVIVVINWLEQIKRLAPRTQ